MPDNKSPLTRSIAVIGYDAGAGTQTTVGGSASVQGGPIVTPLTAITSRAGAGATVTHADGTLGVVPLTVVPANLLEPSSGTGPGLLGTYYGPMDLSGSPVAAFVSPTIDSNSVLPTGAYSARWTGSFIPPVSGDYRFSLRHAGVVRLYVDGRLVASGDSEGLDFLLPGAPAVTAQGTASLSANVLAQIVIEYSLGSSFLGTHLQLGWSPPSPALRADAVAAASAADAAIVFVNDVTYEGMDRTSLSLPGDQNELIAAVAAANPRTIVVLHTAAPVLMPWLAGVAGVIEAWYPGQESGNAISAVLFGDVEAGGRLPMTFPASESQGPAAEPAQYPGIDGTVRYDEGITSAIATTIAPDRAALTVRIRPLVHVLRRRSPAGRATPRTLSRVRAGDEHRRPRGHGGRPALRRLSRRDRRAAESAQRIREGRAQAWEAAARQDDPRLVELLHVEHGGEAVDRSARAYELRAGTSSRDQSAGDRVTA
jgi:hypothetical protein